MLNWRVYVLLKIIIIALTFSLVKIASKKNIFSRCTVKNSCNDKKKWNPSWKRNILYRETVVQKQGDEEMKADTLENDLIHYYLLFVVACIFFVWWNETSTNSTSFPARHLIKCKFYAMRTNKTKQKKVKKQNKTHKKKTSGHTYKIEILKHTGKGFSLYA